MALLLLIVDLVKKVYVLGHDLGVLLLVDILIFLKHLSQVVHILLEILSLLGILSVKIVVTSLVLDLLLDVLLVQADNSRLKLLEVGDVMKDLVNVILELLLVALLLIKILSKVLDVVGKTLLSHSEIVYDKSQILIDSVEVL